MTKFENVGMERQIASRNSYEAIQNFQNSCKVCCAKGMQIVCDRCAISATHNEVLAYFADLKVPELKVKHEKTRG